MRGRPVLIAAGLLVGALVVGAALTAPTRNEATTAQRATSREVRSAEPPAPSASPPPVRSTAAPAATPFRDPDSAAAGDGGGETAQRLVAALHSSDAFAIVEGANGLVERKVTSALPDLESMDITKAPRAAASVIDALGRLAAIADPAARRTAADRLLALLTQERARNAPESDANVLSLYAALGRTLDPRAAAALEAELLDPRVALAAKTVIIEALERLAQPSSAAALRTLQEQLGAMVLTDTLEEDIRRELVTAVERALRVLH